MPAFSFAASTVSVRRALPRNSRSSSFGAGAKRPNNPTARCAKPGKRSMRRFRWLTSINRLSCSKCSCVRIPTMASPAIMWGTSGNSAANGSLTRRHHNRRRRALLSGERCRRRARQDHLDLRPLAGLAVEIEPATQIIGDDAVDDMQAEAGAALAARREERIERLAPDIETHAATVVGKKHFDIALAGRLHPDVDGTSLAVGKRLRDRIENEIGQHLSVGPRMAVHR